MKKFITKVFYKITDFLGWCCVEAAVKCYHMDRFPKMADALYKAGLWFYSIPPVVCVPESVAAEVKKEYLYDWHINFNPYTEIWSAYHRDDRVAYVNGSKTTHRVFSDKTFCGVVDKLEAMHSVDNIQDSYEYESGY